MRKGVKVKIVSKKYYALMWSLRDHKMLIGAEGITAEGSYTWGNKVALRLRPRPRKLIPFCEMSFHGTKNKTN